MKNIKDMTQEELAQFLEKINFQINKNIEGYTNRYPDKTTSYGNSINDDYNGDGNDYAELLMLTREVKAQIEKRNS